MPLGYYKDGTPFKPPSRKGVKLSNEQKLKIGQANIGKHNIPCSDDQKKKISETLKRKFASGELKVVITLEQRIKSSETHKKKFANHVYKTVEKKLAKQRLEWRLWREAIFKRDNYTCQICGARGGKLEPDHIKAWALYPELRFDINNGRTLCHECHKKTPNYGYKARSYKN